MIRTAESVLFTCWPAGARGAVGVDLDVVRLDLDLDGVLHERRHLHARERGVAARLRVVGRDAHEPVHALLGAEQPVGVLAARDEGGGLDAGLVALGGLLQLHLHAAPLRPAHLHPQQHLGPVLRVGAAGAGVHGHDRVAGVVLAREEPRLLELREPRLDRGALLRELGVHRVVLLGHLLERLEVVDVGLERAERLEPPPGRRVLGGHRGGSLLVVPEAGRPHVALELG